MIIKYDMQIDNNSIEVNLKRITNQIYKLLPNREEGVDWETPLTTIMEELKGVQRLIDEKYLEKGDKIVLSGGPKILPDATESKFIGGVAVI